MIMSRGFYCIENRFEHVKSVELLQIWGLVNLNSVVTLPTESCLRGLIIIIALEKEYRKTIRYIYTG